MKSLRTIRKELAIAGAPRRVWRSGEARALTNILSGDEEILACVQTLYSDGLGLVVATNSRLLVVNKSFFWLRVEDEAYVMINSIVYKQGVIFGKLLLSTRTKLYTFHVLKSDNIEPFVAHIDSMMRDYGRHTL